jgi:hypothetical protein
MFDRYPLEGGIGDQAVRADQSKQTAVKLVSAALVVTVQKHHFGPDLIFLPTVQVFNARKTDVNKTTKGGRYVEPWVPVQEGRERQLCLAQPRKLRRPGGFHIGNLMIKRSRNRWFFEGESLKYQRPFQPARTWRFFLENTATVEGGEALRRKLWVRDYKGREARSKYLLDLIARQQADPRAGKPQQVLV